MGRGSWHSTGDRDQNPQEKRNILGLNKWTENKTENKNKDNDNITQFDWKSQPISV